jgi:putative DNA primase/helicase
VNDQSLQRGQSALDSFSKKTDATVTLTRASDVKLKSIEWLWEGFLPRGALTLLAGQPGCGKSTLALGLASTVTSAGRWPDGTPMREPGDVLVWSSEDAVDTTLAPRLAACGANLSRVHFIDGALDTNGERRPFDPATDIGLLTERIESMPDVKLLILDPVLSAVSGDSHKASETRRGLQAVVDIAAMKNIGVLGISHFRKGSKAHDPGERIIGSQAFVALARLVLIASKVDDPDDPKSSKRIIARAKSNISADDGGFEFHLAQVEVRNGIWAQRIEWGGAISGSALELLNDAEGVESEIDDTRNVLDNAVAFLTEALSNEQRLSKDVDREAKDAGISIASLRRARARLNVRSVKSKLTGEWFIEMPGKMLKPSQDTQAKNDEHLEHVERLQSGCGFQPDFEGAQGEDDEHLRIDPETRINVEGAQGAQDAQGFETTGSEHLVELVAPDPKPLIETPKKRRSQTFEASV